MPEIDAIQNFIAGGVGGACKTIVGHPFETVKLRLQTARGENFCLKKFVGEGFSSGKLIRTLYRGVSIPLLFGAPSTAVFFSSFTIGHHMLFRDPCRQMNFAENFCAGAFAGLFTTLLLMPTERVKCMMQVQNEAITMPDIMKCLRKSGGFRSIYQGMPATLLREVPAAGLYLSIYNLLKSRLSGPNTDDLSPLTVTVAGGLAGVCLWTLIMPLDLIKSRSLTAPRGRYPNGAFDVLKEVMQEGPKTFYKGFLPVMLRAFPANGACFFGVELTLWLFKLL